MKIRSAALESYCHRQPALNLQMQQSEQCYIFKYQSDYNSERNALAYSQEGGGGHNAFRSFVGTFGNLSVHACIKPTSM